MNDKHIEAAQNNLKKQYSAKGLQSSFIFLNSINLKSVADLDYEIARIEGNIRIDISTCNAEIEQVVKTVENILVSAAKRSNVIRKIYNKV